MNKKQLICMWCGIVLIVFFTLLFYPNLYRGDLQEWLQRIFLIVLVTGGLIYTFKNKHGVKDEQQKPLNIRRGFRRITILLSIVAWLICSLFVAAGWEEERVRYNVARKKHKQVVYFWRVWDANNWKAGNQGIIEGLLKERFITFDMNGETAFLKDYEVFPGIHKDMLTMTKHSLDENSKAAKDLALERAFEKIKDHERWGSKSIPVIICLSVLAALPAGVISFIVFCFIYFIVRWLILGFRIDTS